MVDPPGTATEPRRLGRPQSVDTDAILDATATAVIEGGFRSVTLADVAARAGVSRRTVYRYFGDRDGLAEALVQRERDRFVAGALLAADRAGRVDDDRHGRSALRPAAEAALTAVLERASTDELLVALRRSDPELLFPVLTSRTGAEIDVVTPAVAAFVSAHLDDLAPGAAQIAVDIIARLLVSYVADPPPGPPGPTAITLADLLVAVLERAQQGSAHGSDPTIRRSGADA